MKGDYSMKREIKFRGKSIKKGEWFYGYLGESIVATRYRHKVIFSNVAWFCSDNYGYIVSDLEVDEETICQYTGLKDKNGKEVYEGDIVRFLDADGKVKNEEVRFWEGGFTPVVEICWMADVEGTFMEVVGNIYDNPELLETE